MIYEDLIEQYKNLDESEAHALLIYKSRLSRAINSLDIDDEEVMEAYNTYKEYLENPSNPKENFLKNYWQKVNKAVLYKRKVSES